MYSISCVIRKLAKKKAIVFLALFFSVDINICRAFQLYFSNACLVRFLEVQLSHRYVCIAHNHVLEEDRHVKHIAYFIKYT